MGRSLAWVVAFAAIGSLGSLATAPPASAHGEEETEEGYLLVQQALGHLAHDTSMSGIDLAVEKVEDALAADDQDGVDLAELAQGKAALEAGDVTDARTLLQDSISEAVASLPPATGNQTGTHQVDTELSGRPDLRAQDWALLAGSVVVLLLGAWLAFLFRPHDTIGTLRARLATAVARDSGNPQQGV